jgi:hypothetical protein
VKSIARFIRALDREHGPTQENNMRFGRRVLVVIALALALAPNRARAESSIVLPRAGQVGLSVGGGYGSLLESGTIGSLYGAGPSLTVRLRYRMRYERGLGLSFESRTLDPRVAPFAYNPAFSDSVAPSQLSMVLSGVEFYQLFDTRSRTTKMLMVGAGLAQMRAELNSGETQLSDEFGSGDGLYVSAGAGVERFFYRSWAWDLSSRYFAVFRDGKANHDVEAALGLIFYASY